MMHGQEPQQSRARAAGRLRLFTIVAICLVAVIIIRVYHDRRAIIDAQKYADLHDAVDIMSTTLRNTPQPERLALSIKYLNSESPGMRYAAVDSLEHAQGDAVANALIHSFSDSSAEVRKRVLDLLPQIDRERGYRLQLAALQDEDSWLRDHAVALMYSDIHLTKPYVDQRAVPLLMQSLNDPDPNVAPLSLPVLRKLTGNDGKDWRYSVLDSKQRKEDVTAKWLAWWAAHRARWKQNELAVVPPVQQTRSDLAPDFTVRDIDRHPLALSSLRGKVVLLNFWGSWCAPCRFEAPGLCLLDREYRDKGLAIVGVALNEKSVDSFRTSCNLNGIQYPQVLEADDLQRVFGNIKEVPVSVLIDKRGMIRRRWDGERDYDTFRIAVDHLLKE